MKNAGKQNETARMNRQRQREREIQRQRERQQNNDMMTESVVLIGTLRYEDGTSYDGYRK